MLALTRSAKQTDCVENREHLRRLANVWLRNPIYFVTVCTLHRKPILAAPVPVDILREAWQSTPEKHGWVVGRYVVMPDHVHFFARPQLQGKTVAAFVRDWKKWTSRRLSSIAPAEQTIWQLEFFDHVVRSEKSYAEKWEYVRQNPVRAGLVAGPDDWPFSGELEGLTY